MVQEQHRPGVRGLVGRLARTGLGAVHNRLELLALEWQEEKAHLMELWVWAAGAVFLAMLAVILFTAVIIFLFRPETRLYVTAGFTVFYGLLALGAWLVLRAKLKRQPFEESVAQLKKDRLWLDSSN